MRKTGILLALGLFIGLASCEKEKEYVYKNGSYKAEAADFHYGWKAFLEAEIKNDELVSVNFDYLDADGNLKSETTAEEYPMTPHPSIWLPQYEAELLAADIVNFVDVDVVTGATSGGANANALMELVLEAAKTGDTETQILTEK